MCDWPKTVTTLLTETERGQNEIRDSVIMRWWQPEWSLIVSSTANNLEQNIRNTKSLVMRFLAPRLVLAKQWLDICQ